MGVAPRIAVQLPCFFVSEGIGETRSPLVPRSKSAVIIHKIGDRCRRTAIDLLFLQFKNKPIIPPKIIY